MKVFISTNVKDEDNLVEWCAYHLLIGFDGVLVVDNNSRIPAAKIIADAGLAQKVTVIPYARRGNIKKPLLNGVVKPFMVRHAVDWFIHLDADEYFNLANGVFASVKDFIGAVAPAANTIALNWVMYGTNHLNQQPEGLVIENFTRCARSHPAVKCLVKTRDVIKAPHVHYWSLRAPCGVDANGRPWKIGFANTATRGIDDAAYISHFVYQSYAKYLERKINRKTDDGVQRRVKGRAELHSQYNAIENRTLVEFGPKIKEFLAAHAEEEV